MEQSERAGDGVARQPWQLRRTRETHYHPGAWQTWCLPACWRGLAALLRWSHAMAAAL